MAKASDRTAERTQRLRQAMQNLDAGHFAQARALVEPMCGDGRADVILAHALAGSGRAARAARLLCRLAHDNPTARHPAQDMMTLLLRHSRIAEIEATLHATLMQTPNDIRLYDLLGEFLLLQNRMTDAVEVLVEGCRRHPAALRTGNLLAVTQNELGQARDAQALLRHLLEYHPRSAMTHANLAHILTIDNQMDQALHHHQQALALRPDDPQIHLNHAMTLLKAGRHAQGWPEYEWRLRMPGRQKHPFERLLPTLEQNTDLTGQRIVVLSEAGLGDMLMYLRFVPALIRRGARVTLQLPREILPLGTRIYGVERVIDPLRPLPAHDWHCPFGSLARALGRTSDIIGAPIPYLWADPEKILRWEDYMPPRPGLRVGIVWGGASRPGVAQAQAIDRKRSMHISQLAPLTTIGGIHLVNLQRGQHAQQMADMPEGMQLYDPMDDVRDMDDTAAIIMNLDIVVSVDTSVVHLAGALGRPTIMMDRYDNCWRWQSGRHDSQWYPQLRIVRQSRPGDWEGVVAQVRDLLAAAAGHP
ncbi:glycosyltransferase family 9 protein [Novacetimonas pomaceti]|nr:glycosyltransferase family 9 protein [Novacetimonas pomaceti]